MIANTSLPGRPEYQTGLANETGTDNPALSAMLIDQVLKACPSHEHDRENLTLATMALMEELRPQNSLEGLLVVQMVCSHMMSMAQLGEAANASEPRSLELHMQLATKIQRTFLCQVETLSKIRFAHRKNLQVEQFHLHAHQGPQVFFSGERSEKQ